MKELEIGLIQLRSNCTRYGLDESDRAIFERVLFSYYRFLYLVKKYPEESLDFAPPVTVDLMWHAHMTMTKCYNSDMMRQLGRVLYHQPWKSAKTPLPIKPDSSFACLWKSLYKTNIEEDHEYLNSPLISFESQRMLLDD